MAQSQEQFDLQVLQVNNGITAMNAEVDLLTQVLDEHQAAIVALNQQLADAQLNNVDTTALQATAARFTAAVERLKAAVPGEIVIEGTETEAAGTEVGAGVQEPGAGADTGASTDAAPVEDPEIHDTQS